MYRLVPYRPALLRLVRLRAADHLRVPPGGADFSGTASTSAGAPAAEPPADDGLERYTWGSIEEARRREEVKTMRANRDYHFRLREIHLRMANVALVLVPLGTVALGVLTVVGLLPPATWIVVAAGAALLIRTWLRICMIASRQQLPSGPVDEMEGRPDWLDLLAWLIAKGRHEPS